MSNQDLTEREIICLFKEGDQSAFKTIYEAYWVYLYRIAIKFSQSNDESEDLVQEVFVDLWSKRENVEAGKPIRPYLINILVHKALNRIRDKEVDYKRDFIVRIRDQYYNNGESNPIQDTIDFDDLDAWLNDELKRLPITSQQIFCLSRKQNFTNREIAEHLNISIKTVESHLSKTLNTLREGIRKKADLVYAILLCLISF